MNMETDVPRIILGTMNFGEQVDEVAADRMLAMFLDRGYKEMDTAYKYVDGSSEEMLGRLLTPERRGKVYLATKASPLSGGGLGSENITQQVNTSLRRLRTDHVDLLYLHAPDLKTNIEVTLEACEKLFKEGKFRELGLSNYASWQVADIWHLCKRNGWIIPSVYQGRYNAVTRDVGMIEITLRPGIRGAILASFFPSPIDRLHHFHRKFSTQAVQIVLPLFQIRCRDDHSIPTRTLQKGVSQKPTQSCLDHR